MNILYALSLKLMYLNSCTFDHLFPLIQLKQIWDTKDTALGQTQHNNEKKVPNSNNAIVYPCSERGKFNLITRGALRTRQSFWCNHTYVKRHHLYPLLLAHLMEGSSSSSSVIKGRPSIIHTWQGFPSVHLVFCQTKKGVCEKYLLCSCSQADVFFVGETIRQGDKDFFFAYSTVHCSY